MLDLGEAKRLEERRHVHPEPPAQPLLQAVPAPNRILRRSSPGFHRAIRRGLLLIGAAQRHPVSVRLEHGVQVLDRAQLVAELGPTDLADDRTRLRALVAIHRVFGRSARGSQDPWVLAGTCSLRAQLGHITPPISNAASVRRRARARQGIGGPATPTGHRKSRPDMAGRLPEQAPCSMDGWAVAREVSRAGRDAYARSPDAGGLDRRRSAPRFRAAPAPG